mmetsp:Transcript_24475/g.45246  ORF Transcript_24475/g.45246 Transcript_24475/m.45246 type:complete len:134 (+) Transcript_24475:1812-2213(+)
MSEPGRQAHHAPSSLDTNMMSSADNNNAIAASHRRATDPGTSCMRSSQKNLIKGREELEQCHRRIRELEERLRRSTEDVDVVVADAAGNESSDDCRNPGSVPRKVKFDESGSTGGGDDSRGEDGQDDFHDNAV